MLSSVATSITFPDLESAMKFLWHRSLLLTGLRETVATLDKLANALTCEN